MIGGKLSIEEEMEAVKQIVPGIRIPQMLSVNDYFDHPFFPAMLYYEGKSKGENKYLLENQTQIDRLHAFLQKEGRPQLKDRLKVKEFINTPSGHYTSYRVIVSSTGEILAAGLLYSSNTKTSNDLVISDLPLSELEKPSMHSLLNYLEIPDSPYFLASKRVISNVAQGGQVIVLNPDNNSCSVTPNS
ncbi:hypothetical protein A2263_01695 [Candidatus Peregrinibacteria bacterium RIFOXYA2_FULL_33_21]|nr:MAG: hypothetical protein A2263_01695 [Candidatus Peregrinibacteria bacterium RIFOXYA2_FULL_33_21]